MFVARVLRVVDLSPGTTYTLRVSPVNEVGTGMPKDVTFTTLEIRTYYSGRSEGKGRVGGGGGGG